MRENIKLRNDRSVDWHRKIKKRKEIRDRNSGIEKELNNYNLRKYDKSKHFT